MKFLVCGDLHLDSSAPGKRQDDYPSVMLNKLHQVNEIAEDTGCEFVVQTGDVFNSLNVTNSYLCQIISLFNGFGLNWYAIAGNHDLHFGKVSKLEQSPLSILFSSCLRDLTEFCPEGGIDGYHFDSKFELPDTINGNADCNILFAHQYPENYYGIEDEVIDREKAQQYDLVILGHEHTNKELEFGDTPVIVPGALSRLTAGADDINRDVCVYTVSVTNGAVHGWERHSLDVPDLDDAYDMHEVEEFENQKSLEDYVEQLDSTEANESSDIRGILDEIETDSDVQSTVLEYFRDAELV